MSFYFSRRSAARPRGQRRSACGRVCRRPLARRRARAPRRSRSASACQPDRPARGLAANKPCSAQISGRKKWQRQGRPARPPGRARQLRRPVQSLDDPGHLHQASRRRQSRPRGGRLCHEHECAGYPGRDAEEQDLHQLVRARGKPASSTIRATSRCCRQVRRRRNRFTEGFFKVAARAESEAQDRRARSRGLEFSPATPAKARAIT